MSLQLGTADTAAASGVQRSHSRLGYLGGSAVTIPQDSVGPSWAFQGALGTSQESWGCWVLIPAVETSQASNPTGTWADNLIHV